MAVAYAKLYEIIHKKIKDEKEAEDLYNSIIEIIKEGKLSVKNELKEELKDELATKKDLELLEERILRYVDNKFHQLDKKIDEKFSLLDKKLLVYFIGFVLVIVALIPDARDSILSLLHLL